MKAPSPRVLERHEAVDVATWLRRARHRDHPTDYRVVWLHIPNEAKRSRREGHQKKREGLATGAPDLLVFGPGPQVAIELKRPRGSGKRDNHATPAQLHWLAKLDALGWTTAVCYGYSETVVFLEAQGYYELKVAA